jgi:prepilin-type N-terminal cleavage/methylation domain-containing protein
MRTKYTHQKGQSLVEVILALAIFTIGAAAVAYLLIISQSSVRLRLERVQAMALAEEGIELVSIIAENNLALLPDGVHVINLSSGIPVIDEGNGVSGIFTRTISVTSTASTSKSVTARVVWSFPSSQAQGVEFTRLFTDWQNK